MRIVLLGDSHLARVRRDLGLLTCPDCDPTSIETAAAGGADVLDLVAQARAAGVGSADRVAVSVGTNDAAPWKRVPLSEAARQLEEFLGAVQPARLVHLSSPGVDEARLGRVQDRTNETVAEYAQTYAAAFLAAGASVVDTPALLAPLGPAAFVADGVHLSGKAYALLLPALHAALSH